MSDALQPGLFHPLGYGIGRKTEPAMGKFLAQEFEFVRREIHHHQAALWSQHPRRLADGAGAVVEEMQHVVNDRDVERVARQRKVENVALADAAILQAGVIEPAARERQHVVGQVDAEATLDVGAEQFENPSGAGAKVEQRADRAIQQHLAKIGLDHVVSGMQTADAVPVARMAAEIILRSLDAHGAHAGEPLPVAGEHGIGGVDFGDDTARHLGGGTMLGAPEERPCTLAEALDQPCFRQELEMTRYAWLRLAQDFGQLRHGQFRLVEQNEDAQARLLAGRLEGGAQIRETYRHIVHRGTLPIRMGKSITEINRHKDIFMQENKKEDRMRDDPYGVREGEVAVALPDHFDAGVYFIGRISTPWTRREECPKNPRESDAQCTITVDPRYAAGLAGLGSCSHILVLYWMDKARRDLVLQAPHHYAERRGTFALRSPVRPNPIAASVARLLRIDGNQLSVVGLDCLDGTPLLDIKPYFASTDAVPEAVVGWHKAKST
jgi:tRNA-Thr(GGU) m(6)t(6)A37 methyltransferase TsaA